MYVAGNLCLSQNVGIGATKLIVGGNLDLDNNAFVGATRAWRTRAETYVGGNCRYQKVSATWHACTGNQDGYNIFSKLSDGVDDRRQPHDAGGRPARRRLRDLVRERDPRPGLVVHDVERHAADVRHQLPEPRQQRLHAVRPHPGQLVHVPRRARARTRPSRAR